MTDRVGRHAAVADVAETMIIPAQNWPADNGNGVPGPDGPDRRAAGRHAVGLAANQAAAVTPGDVTLGPDVVADPARRPVGSSPSTLRLVWVYPDLLSTYGDRGNLLVLSRRARLRGIEVEAIEVNSDQAVPRQGDIYLLGGGEDLPQILAANRLRADGGVAAAAAQGCVVFAVCAGYQVLGDRFGGVEGEPVAGLGVLDISSGRGDRRGVGELVADVDPALSVPRFTGFENHQGVTKLGADARPLAVVTLGVGNGDGTEGAYAGKVLGTYMHGPALARNPGLADLLLRWVVGSLAPIDPDAEDWASQLRAERLAAVSR
jgi:lipid II isoglutaminyl synthase (glutamine-hydrolysing)